MCGIYGSIERTGVAPKHVFDGLKDVDYRGYDSWGISLWNRSNYWTTIKEVGSPPDDLTTIASNISIGHTRWATTGGVTPENAHPHTDCKNKLALVHNGIVDNYLNLKDELSGHKFYSETDTEVIVHLIEEEYKTHHLVNAVKNVFPRLSGLNAFLVSDGKQLIAAKLGSPLVIGKTENGFDIASDKDALLPHTNELFFTADNQMVILDDEALLYSFETGETTRLPFNEYHFLKSISEKGDFPHYMLKEISDQPAALDMLLLKDRQIQEVALLLKDSSRLFFLGCGTSAYAALAGGYLFSEVAGRLVHSTPGSESEKFLRHMNETDTVLAISQSGETIDILEPVEKVKNAGVRLVTITNSFGSALSRLSDQNLLLDAGREKAVLATKTFTSTVGLLSLLAYEIIGELGLGKANLAKNIEEVRDVIARREQIRQIADKFLDSKDMYVLGRGLTYPVAMESALKIKEASYIHSEGFAGGELKHGVIALVEENTPFLAYVPENQTGILVNAMEVKARGARVIGVGAENNPVFGDFFKIDSKNPIIPYTVFAQLFSYYLSVGKGINPDRPRNLAKSVVVR